MTTTVTIGSDDWSAAGAIPARSTFRFALAHAEAAAGRYTSTRWWDVCTDGEGNAQTQIPDAVTGNAVFIWGPFEDTGLPVAVAGYPAATIALTDLIADYSIDPTTLDGTTPPASWWAALDAVHGVPAGGDAGQVLTKTDGTDFNTGWVSPGAGGSQSSNVARTIKRLQLGETLTFAIIGDSVADNTTPGNTGGGPLEKGAAAVAALFGTTVNTFNQAKSGYTTQHCFVGGNVAAVVADAPDLVFVCLGKNDIDADIGSPYAPGYPLAAAMASLERMCAVVRGLNDKADIVILGEGPYTAGSSSNAYLEAWSQQARQVAAVWGAEFIDVYAAFIAYGDYSGLMYDSTHQNPAGNDLYASTIASHFPVNFNGSTSAIAAPASEGLFGVNKVDLTQLNYGNVLNATPGLAYGLTITETGAGWVSGVDSTPGDYVEFSAKATEFNLETSTAVADAAVVSIAVDGVTVATNLALSTLGKQGTGYWLNLAYGLSVGTHVVRVTVVSGTFRLTNASALVAPVSASFTPSVVTVSLTPTIMTITVGASSTEIISATSVPLPAGWTSMDVTLIGMVRYRIQSGRTDYRQWQQSVRWNTANIDVAGQQTWPAPVVSPTTVTEYPPPVPISNTKYGVTATGNVDVIANVASPTTTLVQAISYNLTAICVRKS